MKKFKPFLLILLIFLCSNCAKKYTPEKFPDTYFSFGSGGGYAGTNTEYTLLDNGQLFKSSTTNKELQELEKLKRKTARNLYKSLDSLSIDTLQLNQPGNRYYFITHSHLGKKNTITWGDEEAVVDEKIKKLYLHLNELTNPKN